MEEETCKEVCEKPKCNNNSLLSGPLKNNDGFIGIVGLLLVVLAIGIMTAMYLPTKTAKNEYHQAHYAAGITEVVENAENAYLAKNSTFASMDTLAANGYISSNFLSSLSESTTSHGSEFASTWNVGYIGSQALTACITDATPADVSAGWPGCADNPGMSNGYFIGIYSVPTTYANYLAHELPGSGIGSQSAGLDYLAYSAPIPSAPPVATANYANSAGSANFVNIKQFTQASAQIQLISSPCSPGQYQYLNTSSNLVTVLIGDNGGYLSNIEVLYPGYQTGCADGWELVGAYTE
jgi:competence protein ComGC